MSKIEMQGKYLDFIESSMAILGEVDSINATINTTNMENLAKEIKAQELGYSENIAMGDDSNDILSQILDSINPNEVFAKIYKDRLKLETSNLISSIDLQKAKSHLRGIALDVC